MSARVAVEVVLQVAEGDSSVAVASHFDAALAKLSQSIRAQDRIAIWDTIETWTDSDEVAQATFQDSTRAYNNRSIHLSVLTIDPKEAQA